MSMGASSIREVWIGELSGLGLMIVLLGELLLGLFVSVVWVGVLVGELLLELLLWLSGLVVWVGVLVGMEVLVLSMLGVLSVGEV